MTKRSSKKGESNTLARTLGTLLGAVLLAIILFLANLFGVDLTGNSNSTTPAPQVTITRPTTGGTPSVTAIPGTVTTLRVGQGFGFERGFVQVYFTAPTGNRNAASYTGGIDENLAAALGGVTRTLDIAAFEFNSPALTQAVLAAAERGVTIRMVTDTEHGLEDEDATIDQLIAAGVQVVDDDRSALMHDKFMILDSTIVWTGSWNYTINDTYRNNNSAIVLRSQRAVRMYQSEFDEMFTNRQFGPRSPTGNGGSFAQDGLSFQVFFAAEDDVIPAIIQTIQTAESNIRFMAFSFTLDDVGAAIQDRFGEGVIVQGIFESTGSVSASGGSEMTSLFCAGMTVRQDGNPFFLHHKVFIIDDDTVIVGSFNFSASATDSNDENMVIIQDREIAALYLQEFERRWAEATTPSGLSCN